MHTASSAKRTCNEFRSASEYTATVEIPSSLHAQITRSAISPRLATRIFWNIPRTRLFLPAGPDAEQRLPVFHGLSVLDEDAQHFTTDVGLDLVHEFHGFDDAQSLASLDVRAYLGERLCTRTWRPVIGSDDR